MPVNSRMYVCILREYFTEEPPTLCLALEERVMTCPLHAVAILYCFYTVGNINRSIRWPTRRCNYALSTRFKGANLQVLRIDHIHSLSVSENRSLRDLQIAGGVATGVLEFLWPNPSATLQLSPTNSRRSM